VIPARLSARKDTGATLEVLLLQRMEPGIWQSLIRPAKRAPVGTTLKVSGQTASAMDVTAEVVGASEEGLRVLRFSDEAALVGLGDIPLPPYIHQPLANRDRYQTVYSRVDGSVAAPTAGLHFTSGMLESIKAKGVRCAFVTLHVGLDTFRPVREDDPSKHRIHKEFGIIPADAAAEISLAKAEARRVVCVGTTSVRLVEAAATTGGQPFAGWVDLFIVPGYRFKVADAIVTNFHLPKTTLLMLVSAFAGLDRILHSYHEAIANGYRFYSFGDAMLII